MWFYANLNGWKSYSELLDFARKVFPELKVIIKDAHRKYIYLAYLALYGPFNNEDDWLQGWPSFQEIVDFWDKKFLNSDTTNRLQYAIWRNVMSKMNEMKKEIYPYFEYPSVPTYDPDCQSGFDWVIWIIAHQSGWSSFKQLLAVHKSKDPKEYQKVTDRLFYEFAIRTPDAVENIEVVLDKKKRKLFFEIDGSQIEIFKI
ncbi:MAG: hypothetical protein ACTSO7_06560 [Candidatus Heimdallarchaeota archaeon]